jgi:hypothetical protein
MSRHGQGVGTPKDQGDDRQPGSLPVLIPDGPQAPTHEYLVAVAKIDGERRIPLADARMHLGWSGLLVEMTAAPFWLGVRESPATARRGPHQVLLDERGRLDLGRRAQLLDGRPGDRMVVVTSTLHREVRIVHQRDLALHALFVETGTPLP